MKVQLLGELGALGGGGEALEVRGLKQRTLLAVLALHRGRPVSIDRLVDAVWGEDLPGNPLNALQAQVAQLRRVLGGEAIVTRQGGYALAAAVDIEDFEGLVERGTRLLAQGEVGAAAPVLREALSLCRGEPLAEFDFAEFATGERARLEELRLGAIEARVEADLALGRPDLIGELEALCTAYPLRERLWALRMTALYQAGRQADALRAYAEAREILVEELGVDPGPELQRLEAMVLAHDPALEKPSVSVEPTLRSTGNLPASLTRFVGRQHELSQLKDMLASSRLITLVGPGGAGKSRLALEAAGASAPGFPHGTWLAELAPVTDPAAVAPAIATALGVTEPADGRQAAGSPIDALIVQLAGRSLLLVVDNCEQVILEAASVVEALLKALPGLRVLTTSREALGVPGEQLLPVGPLPLDDAVVLFVDRARAVAPASEATEQAPDLTEEVCRRLDGMPLAIELAAARLRALPLAQLAARLDDRFRVLTAGARTALPRHQTLRAVVDWSYALLFSDERRLFDRIAAFAGPFTLEDAEAVCADGELPRDDVVELLSRLVDKSLVVPVAGAGREAQFSQLQTLWQYGRERLGASGEADVVRARHAAHFQHMGEEAHEGLRGATGPMWRERLTSQLANLRAALDWFIAGADPEGALSLAAGMSWLWFLNGEFSEGARWLGDALGVAGPCRPESRAFALAWSGYFVCMTSSPAAGLGACESAVSSLRESGEPLLLAEAMVLWAAVLMRGHRFRDSLDALAEAHGVLQQAPHEWLLGVHDFMVAFNWASLGELAEAESAARSSLRRLDGVGEILFSIDPLNVLAGIAEARGELETASDAYQELLDRCRAAGAIQRTHVPFRLLRLAAVRSKQGDDAEADRLYDQAIGCSYNPWVRADALVGQAAAARRLGDLDRAQELLAQAGREYDSVALTAGRARVLAALSWWSLAAGQADRAVALAGEAADVASASGDPAMELVAETALAAARAVASPGRASTEAFLALAARRRKGVPYGPLFDEPDVEALCARLDTRPPRAR